MAKVLPTLPCPQRGQESSLFILLPLSVESRPEGDQILQRPDREGTQGSSPAPARPRTPSPREQAAAGTANTLMEAAVTRPTAHTAHRGLRAAPLLRGKSNRTHGQGPAHGHRAASQSLAWAITYWFSSLLAARGDKDRWAKLGSQIPARPSQYPAQRTPQVEEGEGVWLI